MGRRISINLSNKVICSIIILLATIFISVGVSAFDWDNPVNTRHSLESISIPTDCYNDQALKVHSGKLVCEDSSSFVLDQLDTSQLNATEICFNGICKETWPRDYVERIPLVYNEHTSIDCERYEGELYKDDIYSFCRFDRPTCPYGWTQFESWSETERRMVEDSYMGVDCDDNRCTTGYHTFANRPVEDCDANFYSCTDRGCDSRRCTNTIFYATVTKVGCY